MTKGFRDLPAFTVTAIDEGESDSRGYVSYDLTGTFSSLDGVKLGRSWMLLPNLYGLIGDLNVLDNLTRGGTFSTMELSRPCAVGDSLAFLNGYWNANLIKMVLRPEWEWQKVVFSASDAVACRWEPTSPTNASAKGGTVFRKISSAETRTGRPILKKPWEGQRYIGEPWVIPGGWDHEHCTICRRHVDPGDTAYVDPEDRWWFCKECADKYVLRHDLSFISGV